MSGRITKIFILTLAVSFFSCSDVNYNEGKGGREGEADPTEADPTRRGRNFTPPGKPDFSDKNCSEYQSVKSFRPLSDFFSTVFYGSVEDNPLRKTEACVIKSIDQSLKPVCEEERLLKAELKEYKGNREIEEEIQEELGAIEEVKWEYADILYDFADDVEKDLTKTLEFEDTENKWKIWSNILVTREVRGFADVISFRARRLCGATLRRQTRRQ